MLRNYSIMLILCLSLFQATALADPGELDEQGGHYNQKTGEYHYHRRVAPPLELPNTSTEIHSSAIANARRDAIADAQRDNTWYGAGFLFGVFGVGAAYVMTPQVPPVNLLGKSPEYIIFYTDAYQQAMRKLRVEHATTGCLVWSGAVVFYYLYTSGQL